MPDEERHFSALGRRAPRKTPRSDDSGPAGLEHPRDAERRSLDFVQRMVISALLIVVLGLFAAVLAGYLALYPVGLSSQGDRIGLWIMSGVVGLVCAGAVLVTNRRRP